ncbi:MAG: tetratricopeptide repeat protein [Bacteroidetes bacterium]|nr:tetratricopeptide repeat protein [Bacteroidota bacterium]
MRNKPYRFIVNLLLIVFVQLFFCNSIQAQLTQQIDSLEKKLISANSKIEEVEVLLQLSNAYKNSQPEKAYKYIEQSLVLSQKIDYELGIGKSYLFFGNYHYEREAFTTSNEYFDTAYVFLRTAKNFEALSVLNNALGRLNLSQAKYDSAQMFFERSLSYLDSANLKVKKLSTFVNLGNLNFYQDNYEKAEEYYIKGLKIAEQEKDTQVIAMCLSNIGNVLAINGDLVQALDNYIRAVEYYTKINDKRGLADCLNNIGLVNLFLERFEKSIQYFKESQEIYKVFEYKSGIINSLTNIGKAYIGLEDYEEAESNLLKALDISKETEDQYNIVSLYIHLGNFYYHTKDYKRSKQSYLDAVKINREYDDKLIQLDCYESLAKIEIELGNLSEAENHALEALNLAKKINYKINIRDAYENLSRVYEERGNAKLALKNYKLFKTMHDSINNEESQAHINELETRFQTQKKQQQIELQETVMAQQNAELKQNKLLRKTLIGGIIALLLVVSMVSYAYLIKRSANIKINKQKEKIEAQAVILRETNAVLQQQALSAQMNPHFMFNSLNSVQSYILKNDRVKSSDYLSKFSNLMRRVLDNSQSQLITLQEEFNALELYIEMELIRFRNSFEYIQIIQNGVDLKEYTIPPLVLQPFVENAIYHGLRNKEGDKKLKIEVIKKEDALNIIIEDNGIGREEAQKIKRKKLNTYKSYGTEITTKRMELFKETYKNILEHKIIDLKTDLGESAGTRIEIELH